MSQPVFVIVGADLAGARAAEALRAEGFDERVLLIGEEPERPYNRPPLSKDYLQDLWEKDKVYVHPAGLPGLLADARDRHWEHRPPGELAGRTLLVVGLGSIGREVARLAKTFGMSVLAINRTGRADVADVEMVRPPRFLGHLLPRAHAVVLTLPFTQQTRGMIGPQAFGRMRRGAILVNVGRGGVVDEDALIRALKDGSLVGAALDVFATEPLPADSPLWRLPNVLINPHTTAFSVHENERIVALFAENLRRYLRGEDLLSRVHPTLLTRKLGPRWARGSEPWPVRWQGVRDGAGCPAGYGQGAGSAAAPMLEKSGLATSGPNRTGTFQCIRLSSDYDVQIAAGFPSWIS